MNAPAPATFLTLLRGAARSALQWRLLLLWVLAGWIPTAVVALPLWRLLAAQLDHAVQAPQWAQRFDFVMVSDLMSRLRPDAVALAAAALAAVGLMLALLPFLNGLLVAAVRAPGALTLGELLHAGIREYGRMLRLLLVNLLPLAVTAGIVYAAGKAVDHYTQGAILPAGPEAAAIALYVVAALVFTLGQATVDAGRAHLAVEPRRRSAFIAWWRGCRLLLRHPLRGLGSYVLLGLAGALLLAILGLARLHVSAASAPGLLAGWILVQLIVAVGAWLHGARLAALFALARASIDAGATR